jgi:hypothetical protein
MALFGVKTWFRTVPNHGFNMVPNQFDMVPNQVTVTVIWFYRRIRYGVPYAGNLITNCMTENYNRTWFYE